MKLRLGGTLASLGAAPVRNERPDMAVFHPKNTATLLGLVEFKVYASHLDCARKKLLQHISTLDVPPFGAACAMHAANVGNQDSLGALKKQADNLGDTWYCVEAHLPQDVTTQYLKHYFVVRGFH